MTGNVLTGSGMMRRTVATVTLGAALAASGCTAKDGAGNAGAGGTTGTAKVDSPATTRAITTKPTRKTPSLADIGQSTNDPATLSASVKEDYLALLSFAPGASSDEAECPNDSCDTGDPRATLRIEPEVGAHELTRTDFESSWHIVARITLVGDLDKEHKKYKLNKNHRVAFWWVGMMNGKLKTIVVRAGGSTVSVRPHPFCIRRDPGAQPKSAVAKWKNPHMDWGNCVNDTSLEPGYMATLTADDLFAIRTFHDTWFACDVGCCGSLDVH